MVRIKGIDIPNDKRIEIALTYIYGIGKKRAQKILSEVGIDFNKKAKDLDNEELLNLRDKLNNYLVEGDLRREISMNIKIKQEIGSYQGIRHRKGLPVRGQRTNRNARTRKGPSKVIANKKKASK